MRQVRERSDPDPPADQEGPVDLQPEPVPQRPEDVDRLAGLERGERLRPRPDRVDQEPELTGRRDAEGHRPRQQPARRLEHEELPWNPVIEPTPLDP
jgi:hypothetical protein